MAEGILIARQEDPPPSSITMGGYGGGDSSSPPSGASVGGETPRVASAETTASGETAAGDVAGPSTTAQGFVNEGEKRWQEQRQGWLSTREGGVKKLDSKKRRTSSSFLEPSLLSSLKPFPKPLPLSDVVDALLEEWEESGYS